MSKTQKPTLRAAPCVPLLSSPPLPHLPAFPLLGDLTNENQYILPKMPHPLPKKQKLAPGQERSLTISLKSLRNPPLDITLKSQLPSTSILDLKEEINSQTSIPTDKLRILFKKKPVPDSKILSDLVGEEESKVEFAVMVLGGAAKKGEEEIIPPVAQGASGVEALANEEFWGDLRGFLVQKLRDEGEGEKVFGVFRKAWEQKK
jgi:hypothetical protein